MTDRAAEVRKQLRTFVDPAKAVFLPRFFKTGPGEYGEGDKFIGVTVPNVRSVAKHNKDLPLDEIERLLKSEWHEERQVALFILVGQYSGADLANKKVIYDFYLAHTEYINNWDLVDSTAGYIVGRWLDTRPEKMQVLTNLAESPLIWERRIAMIATFAYIYDGRADEALVIAEKLLNDTHDLIQKAVGWMLREVGKRADRDRLVQFLDEHAATMPRTTLRYAIEHFSPEIRAKYLALKTKTA